MAGHHRPGERGQAWTWTGDGIRPRVPPPARRTRSARDEHHRDSRCSTSVAWVGESAPASQTCRRPSTSRSACGCSSAPAPAPRSCGSCSPSRRVPWTGRGSPAMRGLPSATSTPPCPRSSPRESSRPAGPATSACSRHLESGGRRSRDRAVRGPHPLVRGVGASAALARGSAPVARARGAGRRLGLPHREPRAPRRGLPAGLRGARRRAPSHRPGIAAGRLESPTRRVPGAARRVSERSPLVGEHPGDRSPGIPPGNLPAP